MDMVRRLIGPAGPELSCDECFDLLDVYVELERGGAGAAAMPAMRTHLLGCPACRDDHDSLRALLDLLVAWLLRSWREALHSVTLLTLRISKINQ